MLRNAKTAVKFFAYGIMVGLVFAPQSGAETRKQIMSWIGDTLGESVGNMTGSSSGSQGS